MQGNSEKHSKTKTKQSLCQNDKTKTRPIQLWQEINMIQTFLIMGSAFQIGIKNKTQLYCWHLQRIYLFKK